MTTKELHPEFKTNSNICRTLPAQIPSAYDHRGRAVSNLKGAI